MSDRPGILVTGGTGQIGGELVRELAAIGTIVAPPRSELDLHDAASIRDVVRRIRPAIIVNAAGYTAVERAESEPLPCARANADAPAIFAEESRRLGALLVHFSTDYVFDGKKNAPYVETDDAAPLNVYGRTKLAGDDAIVTCGGAYLILRTAWIYGARGHNFLRTMLRLSREREEIAVVDDQIGAPTSAVAVAGGVTEVLQKLVRARDFRGACEAATGLYNMTASGMTTWHAFALGILAFDPRRSEQVCRSVRPITSAEWASPARRPSYSVLDNSKLAERFGVRLEPWPEQLGAVLEQVREMD